MGYLTNFIVYMLAMVGVLVVAMLIFKHTNMAAGKCGNGKCLKVLDTLSLGARKTLYIVSAGEEKFLIACDVDRTSLISKLNPKSSCEERISSVLSSELSDYSTKSYENSSITLPKRSYMDKSLVGINSIQTTPNGSVMRSMVNKLNGGKLKGGKFEVNLEGSINE